MTFYNASGQTVTVMATSVDPWIAVANGISTRLWSDGITIRQIT